MSSRKVKTVPGADFPCPLCRRTCAPVALGELDAGELGIVHAMPVCALFEQLEADEFLHLGVMAAGLIPPEEGPLAYLAELRRALSEPEAHGRRRAN